MQKSLMFVFSNPVDGEEDAYNEWYDNQHIPDIFAVPGVVAVQRYELVPLELPEGAGPAPLTPPTHRYVAIYELDRDPAEVVNGILALADTDQMRTTDALDMSTLTQSVWQPRGERRVAD
ncbi:hypothetical protein MINTM020_01070 [Mycobacterium paraintracellulare]|uniref:DUF4286 family protein n=1 Tax=Mycobacterium paraintracellulare TaxID=1138383 RepID=UPI001925684E|nr:DUF4286 family protein [Mycobacterium paraintracellulare]BCP08009.1 hypothetical protein MINTM020_01070 [Mycobacterium paraintracellulare]